MEGTGFCFLAAASPLASPFSASSIWTQLPSAHLYNTDGGGGASGGVGSGGGIGSGVGGAGGGAGGGGRTFVGAQVVSVQKVAGGPGSGCGFLVRGAMGGVT